MQRQTGRQTDGWWSSYWEKGSTQRKPTWPSLWPHNISHATTRYQTQATLVKSQEHLTTEPVRQMWQHFHPKIPETNNSIFQIQDRTGQVHYRNSAWTGSETVVRLLGNLERIIIIVPKSMLNNRQHKPCCASHHHQFLILSKIARDWHLVWKLCFW